MGLSEKIDLELKQAMFSGDTLKRDVLRGLKTTLTNWRIANLKEPQDSEIIALIKTALKSRIEASELYKKADKPLLAQKEEQEATILKAYLPTQLDEAATQSIIDEILDGAEASQKNIAFVMQTLRAKHGDAVDFALASRIAKQKLD